jgi:hypothetical protein
MCQAGSAGYAQGGGASEPSTRACAGIMTMSDTQGVPHGSGWGVVVATLSG